VSKPNEQAGGQQQNAIAAHPIENSLMAQALPEDLEPILRIPD
jgi:hypothetical protein